jgi:protein TonB
MNRTAVFLVFSAALHLPLAALVMNRPNLPETAPLMILFEERAPEKAEKPEPKKQRVTAPKTEQVKSPQPKTNESIPEPQRPAEDPRVPVDAQSIVAGPTGPPVGGPDVKEAASGEGSETVPSVMPTAAPAQTKNESPPPAPRDIETLRRAYFQEVMRRIDSKKEYPPIAIRRNWQGKVGVVFTIKVDGSIGEVKVIRKSEYSLLDEAAVDAVKRAAPFPSPPEELSPPLTLRLDIAFTLSD